MRHARLRNADRCGGVSDMIGRPNGKFHPGTLWAIEVVQDREDTILLLQMIYQDLRGAVDNETIRIQEDRVQNEYALREIAAHRQKVTTTSR